MHVQVNSDNNVDGGKFADEVQAEVESTLHRFADRITRVEVHLGDENAGKSGQKDKRCMMEARLAGLQPIAVTAHAPTLRQAIDGASEKLERALESTLGKLADPRSVRPPIADDSTPAP